LIERVAIFLLDQSKLNQGGKKHMVETQAKIFDTCISSEISEVLFLPVLPVQLTLFERLKSP